MLKISNNILEKLKCSSCNGYLSTSPVILKETKENICGNCTNDQDNQCGTRNEVYEHLASVIQFPCRYKKNGCTEKLAFDNVSNHEKGCEHRLYECPLIVFNNCTWEGKPGYLKQHFEDSHNDLIIRHPYTFHPNITRTNEQYLLVEVLSFMFLVQVQCNLAAAKLWFCIRFIGNSKFASLFTYKLKTGDSNNKITMKNDVQSNETLLLSRNNVTEIDINSLLRIAKDIKQVLCTMKISLKNNNCVQCSADGTGSKIFLSENGYLCINCNRKQMQVCKFESKGCIYKDYAMNIPKHELWLCRSSEQQCIYSKDCNIKTSAQGCQIDHVVSHHCENKIIELLQGSTGAINLYVNTKYEGCLAGYNALFITNYNFTYSEKSILQFKIISNLPKSEIIKFKCELKLFNVTNSYSSDMQFDIDLDSVEYDWHLKYEEDNDVKKSILRACTNDYFEGYMYSYKLKITRDVKA